jgi:hypothetical protein
MDRKLISAAGLQHNVAWISSFLGLLGIHRFYGQMVDRNLHFTGLSIGYIYDY